MPRQYYTNFPEIAQEKSRANIEQRYRIVRNNPINQFKDALVIETAKITTVLIFESKNKLVIQSIEIKRSEKCYVLIFKKDIWKKKKTLLQWILPNILENQTFQETAKFIEMKGIVILVKVDERYNILKSLTYNV